MPPIQVPATYASRFSHLWIRKQLTYFRVYDSAARGRLTSSDVAQIISSRAEKVLPQEQNVQLPSLLKHSWRILAADPRTGRLDNHEVSFGKFIENRFTASTEGAGREEESLREYADVLIKVGDVSHTGDLDFKEFRNLSALYGLPEKDSKSAFKLMDTDKDGLISKSEFTDALVKFFFSTERDNGAMVFGHLAWDDIDTKRERESQQSLEHKAASLPN